MSLDPVKLCEFCGENVNGYGHRPECVTQTDEWADEHCASCGQAHVWHGRDEKDRVCPECRFSHLETD